MCQGQVVGVRVWTNKFGIDLVSSTSKRLPTKGMEGLVHNSSLVKAAISKVDKLPIGPLFSNLGITPVCWVIIGGLGIPSVGKDQMRTLVSLVYLSEKSYFTLFSFS